jgi:4-hydroxyacetophenone monooxygenase
MLQADLDSRFTHSADKCVVTEDELRKHVQAADTVTLLLCATQVTGDASLLDRYGDKVGRSSFLELLRSLGYRSDSDPEVSPQARQDLIDLLCAALTRDDQPDYLRVDAELFRRMGEIATGMPLSENTTAMSMEQAGFVHDQRAIEPTKNPPGPLNLAIVGAGMAGLDAGVKAATRGFEFDIYEKEAGTGGLWWTQTYPGVAVDTPSIYYSLSYELSPNWTKFFPAGPEYRAYLTGLAEKHELTEHFHVNSDVTQLKWLEDDQVWELTIFDRVKHASRTERAAAVLTGAGHLCRPKYPDIEGRETFAGDSIHTTRWRDIDLAGKRVAVVGVGAAGIQVISALASQVGHLTTFQHQPHWVSPNTLGDGKVGESEHWLRRHLPYYLHWSRFVPFFTACETAYQMNLVDEAWMKEHSTSTSALNEALRQSSLQYIHECFGEDSEMARKLTPDFPYGGKRPVRDPGDFEPGGYYWALAQPHVDLVTSAISRVVPEGIVTADGRLIELDAIIWATGMTFDWLSTIQVIGRGGVRLSQVWANNNPRSYLGGTVPGFPNLFINDGPNTGVAVGGGGHNFMAETVNHYAFECLQLLVERGGSSIEVTKQAHDEHNELIEREMSTLLWSRERKASTYYRNESGRVILPSPFRPEDFWTMCQKPDEAKFVIHHPEQLTPPARE